MVLHTQDSISAPMKISELSEMTGVSKSTIHHYVKIGLLPPPSRARSNLYLYGEAHVRGLERIERLKATENLSLEQVKEALERDRLTTEGDSPSPSSAIGKDQEQSEAQTAPNMHEIKKIQIIDKAIMLFTKLGYEAVKVSDITDALQMGKGTFYLYFKNKRELFLACFDRLDLLIERLEMRDDIREQQDLFRKMRLRWTGFNENFDTFRGVLSLIRTACRSDEGDVRENAAKAYYAWIEPVKRDVEQAIVNGTVRPVDSELATFFMLGMAESFSFRLDLDSRYTEEEVAELFYSLLKRGLIADGKGEGAKGADRGCRVTATDLDGVPIELSGTRFNGVTYLGGKLGASEMKVDPSKLSTINIRSTDSKCFALLTAKSGQEISLEVDGSTVVSGDTPFGNLEIAVERISCITVCSGEQDT